MKTDPDEMYDLFCSGEGRGEREYKRGNRKSSPRITSFVWSRKSYPLRVIFFELLPQGERRQRLNTGGKVHICLWRITLPWKALEVESNFWSSGGYADPSKQFGSNCALNLQPSGSVCWEISWDAGIAQDAEHHRDAERRSCAIGSVREQHSF